MLIIENHGPLIVASNYWESDYARGGKLYLSTNAGAFRLLVPPAKEAAIAEMRTAREVIVSLGPWPALELLFDDDTDSPYALQLGLESLDRLPLDADQGRELILSVWTAPRRGGPHKALERPAWYRRVPSIPWLRPWQDGIWPDPE